MDEEGAERPRRIRRILGVILVFNLIVVLGKLIFGFLAGSVSMVADGLHSVVDSSSNVIGIVALWVTERPPDPSHPYGHGKFEPLATLFIGALLILTTGVILFEAYDRIVNPHIPEITVYTVSVLVFAILVSIVISWYEQREGGRLRSMILVADSRHTLSDVFVSLSVLAGFGAVYLGFPFVEPLVAIGIALLIGRMGVGIIREAGMVLTDASSVPCDEKIEEIVTGVRGVEGFHQFRCRGTPAEMLADIHVDVNPAMSVEEAHAIAREVERVIQQEYPAIREVTVHIGPAKGKTET
jgi:cation diffusion facilitator family transporter